MSPRPDPDSLRARLAQARLMLVFTPDLARDPAALLEALADRVDVVQVRPKPLGQRGTTSAREALEWCRTALETLAGSSVPVIVNDRVDVARVLWKEGLAGVHLGQDDTPADEAREFLGSGPLIGLSTHGVTQVALAEREPVDYLGFGPIYATATKGYERGLGSEQAWVASSASPLPLFPIGGIDLTNVAELTTVGRAAVGSALMRAEDPGRAARELRELLCSDE